MVSINKQRAMIFALLVAAALYSLSFYPFLSDDTLISLRYSQRLLDGHGLTWTEGTPVEGYTNLAWVLLTAALGWLGMDLIVAARVLGVACALLSAWAIWSLPAVSKELTQEARLGKIGGLLLYGLCGTTAVWAIGGLEQPLVGASLAWALVGVLRLSDTASPRPSQAVMPGLAYAVMCLTRPDSPLFVVASCLALLMLWRLRHQAIAWRVLIVLAGIPLAAYLAQTLFRYSYYDAWVTNTALVKVRPSLTHALSGLKYAAKGFVSMLPLLIAALASWRWLSRHKHQGPLLVLSLPTVLWLSYMVFIGGDIFPAFRHFTPLVTLLSLSVGMGAGAWLARLTDAKAWGLLAGAAAAMLACQVLTPDVDKARKERWEWDGRDVALMLRDGFAPRQPLLAVTAAGCLPYWSGFPVIDMLGLNDHYLPRHPPKTAGQGYLGHELGSGPYVLGRQPDLIMYHLGQLEDEFLTGKELARMPEFLARYTPVRFHVRSTGRQDFESVIWLNRESTLIGMRREAGALHIPGYLVNSNNAAQVHLAGSRKLVMRIPAGSSSSLTIPGRLLPSGPVSVVMQASGPAQIDTARTAHGDLELKVSATSGTALDLQELVVHPAP